MSLHDEREDRAPIAPELAFGEFRHAVSDAVVALDMHSARQESFRGAIDAATAGDIHVFHIDADTHAVHRTPGLIARAPQRFYKLSLIESGSGIIVQDGRETALGPGDMAIYDTDRPYSLVFDDAVRMSVVMFPKSMLDVPNETVLPITATLLNADATTASMIRPFVAELAQGASTLDPHVARRLMRNAVDMVGTLLEANLDESASAHEALLRRISDYIDDNIPDPGLNPAQIAAAHFVSVRHLHGLFSEQGTTVSTLIRTRRLERCYDDLVAPQSAHRSITAIALAHGFVDPAHFSRTFRAHFGVPPSGVRE